MTSPTATLPSRTASLCRRLGRTRARRRRSLLAAVVTASLALGAGSARADETFEFEAVGSDRRISLIGDSTLAGVRWYADYGELRRFDFVLNAESCRRTIEQSCFSREGYRSANVISTMRSLDGSLGELLVIMSGYNDPVGSIDDAIDTVVDEARRQGVAHVVWLTLRTSADVDYSDPQEQTSVDTFREFNERLVAAAEGTDGFLQVADWATYSTGSGSWFEYDGVHLTPSGVDALTTFLAGTVERVLAGEDVSPASAPWTLLVPGAEGDVVVAVQEAVMAAGVEVPGGADGVYGNDTMIAVADYQRLVGDLQVTGAVDLATARSLGVYSDGETEEAVEVDSVTPVVPSTTGVPAALAASPDLTLDAEHQDATAESSAVVVAIAVTVVLGLLVIALVTRRRPPGERPGRRPPRAAGSRVHRVGP